MEQWRDAMDYPGAVEAFLFKLLKLCLSISESITK
jgi:hypothetical protein